MEEKRCINMSYYFHISIERKFPVELISALSLMVTMSVSFSLLTARYVRNQERRIAVQAIDTLIDSLQQALPDVVIRQKTIPFKQQNSHPYDWQSEEAFEQIVKDFNN